MPVVDVVRKKTKEGKREAKQQAKKAEQNANGAVRDLQE